LSGGPLIESFTKLHNINAVLSQGRAYGWRRIRFAGVNLQLDYSRNLFSHCPSPPLLNMWL
jgi:hypothetical protein